MTQVVKPRRILINDDGWIMSEAEPPLTTKDLKRRMVDTYAGSPIGALFWCIGNREVYNYETKVGQVFGQGFETFENATDRRHAENVKRLADECGRAADSHGRSLPRSRDRHLPFCQDEQPLRG